MEQADSSEITNKACGAPARRHRWPFTVAASFLKFDQVCSATNSALIAAYPSLVSTTR